MKITRTLSGFAALLLLPPLLMACTPSRSAAPESAAPASAAGESDISPVVLLGDSISVGLSAPLTEAFAASGNRFRSLASDGGGNVTGPFSEKVWEQLPAQLTEAEPGLVVYQITSYDWGTEAEQREAYRRLVDLVASLGARLVFVTPPPLRADDFYEPHLDELQRTAAVAADVADASDGVARLLDAVDVWGQEYQQERDGVADRSSDGVHVCPQGAARYTVWLLDEIASEHSDFTPAPVEEWANTGWSSDEGFRGC
ncbi:SGNH/GDSL hydrolase family protein [Microbacterium sp. 179-I 3D3 NHS]|uniref:SGNH/GDSL hydrolase family protein n=1 Tax=unclassified Microbacterium TaxID=2609290 RepID=UPI00399F35E7